MSFSLPFCFLLGIWKKLLGVFIFLSVVSLVCGLMLPPNSPFIKAKCREGSIPDHYLEFTYYPTESDVRIGSVCADEKDKQTNKQTN